METNFQKEISSNFKRFFVTQIISMMVRNDIINKILERKDLISKILLYAKIKKS